MSAITSRPRVRAVSCTPLSASALLASGAVVLSGQRPVFMNARYDVGLT